MLFSEPRFFVFFFVVLGVYWSLRSNRWRKRFLLVASYVFYGAWDYRFLALILFSTVVDYWAGGQLDRKDGPGRRRLLVLSCLVNLGALGAFKYFNFFVESGAELLAWLGFGRHDATLSIVLPVGISFYTLQSMTYTIDIYRRSLKPTRDAVDFFLYVAFFPQLVAGPIVRASDFLPQLETSRTFAMVRWRSALWLFLIGFFKKVCVSDNVAPFVDAFYEGPERFDLFASFLAPVLYSVQIYCDFSGYSDMAIATAALLGYRLCENFKHPYFSPNVAEFWRRWHISLSFWLRDYLYIPLGGNQHGEWKRKRNLMLTMLIGGLWHGAAWTFVGWGFLHGAGLVVHRWFQRRGFRLPHVLGVLLTFSFWTFTMILFRSTSMEVAFQVIKSTLLLQASGPETLPFHLVTALVGLWVVHLLACRGVLDAYLPRLKRYSFAVAYGAAWAIALNLIYSGERPFIYFQF